MLDSTRHVAKKEKKNTLVKKMEKIICPVGHCKVILLTTWLKHCNLDHFLFALNSPINKVLLLFIVPLIDTLLIAKSNHLKGYTPTPTPPINLYPKILQNLVDP
jgi:hypothetical protein